MSLAVSLQGGWNYGEATGNGPDLAEGFLSVSPCDIHSMFIGTFDVPAVHGVPEQIHVLI